MLPTNLTPIEIFDVGIASEALAYRMYDRLARRVEVPTLQARLTQLRKDEKDHRKTLRAHRRGLFGSAPSTVAEADAEAIFGSSDVPEIREQAEVVVLLAYSPVERARSIALAVPGVDLVFVANNFFPDHEVASKSGNVTVAPVVLQSRTLTEVRGWRATTGAWRFEPRSVLLDGAIPSDGPTLELVYRARADIIR